VRARESRSAEKHDGLSELRTQSGKQVGNKVIAPYLLIVDAELRSNPGSLLTIKH
jgi:hypothetical protein